MRGRRLHRLLQILALLKGAGNWNARTLAEHLRTSRRNVYRDLAVLELAGVPYWYDPDRGEGGSYRVREGFFFPAVALTNQECLDMAVLAKLAETQGVPLVGDACQVRDKLFDTLPAEQQDLIGEATALFDVLAHGVPDGTRCRAILIAVQKALLGKRQLSGTYRSPAGTAAKAVRLQPRRAFLHAGTWYLAAHDNADGTTKLYRLSRFDELRTTNKPLTVAEKFSLRDYLGNAWAVHRGGRDYAVEVVFTADAVPLVEECRWHPTQELERLPDGRLRFRATVSGLDEVKFWVLGWGPRAVVTKPKELADEVRRLLSETLCGYANGRSS